ncbi:MAG: SpoIIE family protein phosphatase [Solobacterium sp.]|nr:SpoIIE family protein phosphatase [Solobacterium sp.]
MNDAMYIECGWQSVNHVGEQLCGDNVNIVDVNENSRVMVLADGLGSGVKANILSTLTAKMMSEMLAGNVHLTDCVDTVISTLPVCRERGVAYSTFSIAQMWDDGLIRVFNFDNPKPFIIHKGVAILPDYETMEISGRKIDYCSFEADENDCLFMMSDGTINAGAGEILNYGWQLPQIMDFMEGMYQPFVSAKALATILVDRCNILYNNKPGDDTTAAVVRIRKHHPAALMVGPASNREDDERMVKDFLNEEGTHIVCGGTTAKVVSKVTQKDIEIVTLDGDDSGIPPISKIEGIDLVTEGMITLHRVYEYAQDWLGENKSYFDWNYRIDGASLLATELLEKDTDITFYVGCAVNPAHQEDDSLGFKLKLQLIDNLAAILKKMDKEVKVRYF